jgi:hypothetical protein
LEEVILTKEQLQQKCNEWQKRLRLQDWIITVKICRYHETDEGRQAEVTWALSKKMASIKVVNSNDYPPDCMAPQDMENALVHELLHLHFAPLTKGQEDDLYIQEEHAIESITSGLITALKEKGDSP